MCCVCAILQAAAILDNLPVIDFSETGTKVITSIQVLFTYGCEGSL